ncbi:MAG: hypothetical protein GXO42_01750 [bacterium]|nr:hypothetical protein [bacterium]
MQGIVLYKIADPQIIKEVAALALEYNIPRLVLCNISSQDALPGIAYCLRLAGEGLNVLFFQNLQELFSSGIISGEVATLSCSVGERPRRVDWLILGYLDALDIERFKIRMFKVGRKLLEVGALAKYLFETHEAGQC